MTSRNIDPVTGRAVGDDARDPIGPGSPEGSGGDGTGYATDPDAALPQLGDRDHTARGVGYDPDAAEPIPEYSPREGFDPGAGTPGLLEDSPSDGVPGRDDAATGGLRERAGQVGERAGEVGGTVAEQATAVRDSVAEQAGRVGDVAVQRAGDVAGVARDEIARLAGDTRGELQSLWDQAATRLREQAGAGQRQLAEMVHALAGELGELASKAESDGPVTALIRQAAYRGGQFSHWLSEAETGDVLTEVRRFARRRPVVFLAGATLAGIVVGRLGRGLMAAAKTEQDGASGSGSDVRDRAVTDGGGRVGEPGDEASVPLAPAGGEPR